VKWINRAKDYRTEKNDIQGGFDIRKLLIKIREVQKKKRAQSKTAIPSILLDWETAVTHTVGRSYINRGISSCILIHIKGVWRLDRFTDVFPWEYILYNYHASL
jgi:hypothetical protein